MSQRPVPLFVDTAAFFAWFDERAAEHDRARNVFGGIRAGDLPYDPLFTSRCVLSELATLMLRKVGHASAATALETIRGAESFNVLHLDRGGFDRTCAQFARYDDQQISFVDHASGVLADGHGIEHVFTFDGDFRTLGFAVVPSDPGEG